MSFQFHSLSLSLSFFLSPPVNNWTTIGHYKFAFSHFNCINDDIIVPITYRLAYRLALTIIVYTLVCGCMGDEI